MICVTVDVRDDEGRSLLDLLLEGMDDPNSLINRHFGFLIAHYLLSCGYGDEEDRVKWLYKACWWGKLYVVEELVERHNVDPNGEHTHSLHGVYMCHVHISKRVDIALWVTLTQW